MEAKEQTGAESCLCIDSKNVGCVDLFHYLLWKKLGEWDFNAPADGQSFAFRVPDTVVFSRYRPTEWFFTSKKDGLIKRKHGQNVTIANIAKAFAPSAAAQSRSPIVATFVYCSDYLLDRDQPYVSPDWRAILGAALTVLVCRSCT